jgi:hypothetical protein
MLQPSSHGLRYRNLPVHRSPLPSKRIVAGLAMLSCFADGMCNWQIAASLADKGANFQRRSQHRLPLTASEMDANIALHM